MLGMDRSHAGNEAFPCWEYPGKWHSISPYSLRECPALYISTNKGNQQTL